MAINLEKELKTISIRLKALSKKVDHMAGGMGKSKTAKRDSVSQRDTAKAGHEVKRQRYPEDNAPKDLDAGLRWCRIGANA